MKKFFTLSLTMLAVAAFAAGMKSNKVGNGSFPSLTSTTQEDFFRSQGIPPDDLSRCASSGYPATRSNCPQTSIAFVPSVQTQLNALSTGQLIPINDSSFSGGQGGGAISITATGGCQYLADTRTLRVTSTSACQLVAIKGQSGLYAEGPPLNSSFAVTKGTPSLTFNVASPIPYGTSVTLSATSTGAVVPMIALSQNCSAFTLNQINKSLQANAAGTCTLTASSASDANFNAASLPPVSVSVNNVPQTINFPATVPNTLIVGNNTNLALSNNNSTGAISYEFSGSCTAFTITNTNQLNAVAAGSCSLVGKVVGDTTYAASETPTKLITSVLGTLDVTSRNIGRRMTNGSCVAGNQSVNLAVTNGTPPYQVTCTIPSGQSQFTKSCSGGSNVYGEAGLAYAFSVPTTNSQPNVYDENIVKFTVTDSIGRTGSTRVLVSCGFSPYTD